MIHQPKISDWMRRDGRSQRIAQLGQPKEPRRTCSRWLVEFPKTMSQYFVCVDRNPAAYLPCQWHCAHAVSTVATEPSAHHSSMYRTKRPYFQPPAPILPPATLRTRTSLRQLWFAHVALSAISRCRRARTFACRFSRSLRWNCRSLHAEEHCTDCDAATGPNVERAQWATTAGRSVGRAVANDSHIAERSACRRTPRPLARAAACSVGLFAKLTMACNVIHMACNMTHQFLLVC